MSKWRSRGVLISSLPGAACLGLALLIHHELTNPPAPPASQEALADAVAVEPLPPQAVASPAALDLFSAVIERPVFSPTRRPAEEPPPPAPERAPVVQNPRFSLVGIIISEMGRFVLAMPEGGVGGVMRVGEGRSIDGWTVARVEPDRAVFRQGETENLMILEFFERSEASPNSRK
ncbi:MAG TPA: hypothetical protein VLE23_07735 [Geminicoccaceae bacterium]|nr:hypothetical protein [Geminicoccaceae bacterium]